MIKISTAAAFALACAVFTLPARSADLESPIDNGTGPDGKDNFHWSPRPWPYNRFPMADTCCAPSARSPGDTYTLHTFKTIRLTEQFWSEGATFGDFNHDGKKDIVSGPYWWEGPDFQKRHEYYAATKSFTTTNAAGENVKIPGFEGALGHKNTYSDNF